MREGTRKDGSLETFRPNRADRGSRLRFSRGAVIARWQLIRARYFFCTSCLSDAVTLSEKRRSDEKTEKERVRTGAKVAEDK